MNMEHENTPLTTIKAVNPSINDQINHRTHNPQTSSSSSPASRWHNLLSWDWIWECLCCILVIGALAAMISVIAVAHDQPMTI